MSAGNWPVCAWSEGSPESEGIETPSLRMVGTRICQKAALNQKGLRRSWLVPRFNVVPSEGSPESEGIETLL